MTYEPPEPVIAREECAVSSGEYYTADTLRAEVAKAEQRGAAHWRDEWSEVCNENQCLINVLRDTLAKIERYEVKRWDDETFADVVSKIKEVLK